MAATRKPRSSSVAGRRKAKAPAENGAPREFANGSRHAPAAAAVSFEAIQRRAYEIFLARGGWHGADVADWLAAERELKGPARALD